MRIEKLDESTKKNLLEDLLKRSPNSYGKYEESVRQILDDVKEKRDEAVFAYTKKFDGVEIRQLHVPDSLVGRSIEETKIRQRYKLNIIAIESGDETFIEIMPDYRLKSGDIIVVIGRADNIDALENDV